MCMCMGKWQDGCGEMGSYLCRFCGVLGKMVGSGGDGDAGWVVMELPGALDPPGSCCCLRGPGGRR